MTDLPSPAEIQAMMDAENYMTPSQPLVNNLPSPAEVQKMMDAEEIRNPKPKLNAKGIGLLDHMTRSIFPTLSASQAYGALKDSTFGAVDEIGSAGNALIDKAFGDDRSLSDIYGAYKKNTELFEDQGGADMLVGELVGGGATGGMSLLKTAGSTLGKKMLLSALTGAGSGAVYGFNDGRDGLENRVNNSINMGSFGGVIGLGAPLVAKGIGKMFLNKTPKNAKLTPANKKIASKLTFASDDELVDSLRQMQKAKEMGNPLYIYETDKIGGSLENLADYVANNDATGAIAKRSIRDRTSGGLDRVLTKLDDLSPTKSVFDSNSKLIESAKNKIKQVEQLRSKAAAPFYNEAYNNPIVENKELKKLIGIGSLGQKTKSGSSKLLTGTIKKLKDTFPEIRKLPDNHIKILDLVKKDLDDRISSAIQRDNKNEVKNLVTLKNSFLDAIDKENPSYKQARAIFESMSPEVTGLTEGQLGVIQDLTDKRIKTAAKKIFELEPEQIADLKIKLGNEEAFDAGVKAFIQDQLENTTSNRNAVNKLIGSQKAKDKLRAALGEKADDLIEFLENENKISFGKNRVGKGSDTALRQQQNLSLSKVAMMLQNPKNILIEGAERALDGLTDKQQIEFRRKLAEALFDNDAGRNAINDILKYRTASGTLANRNSEIVNQLTDSLRQGVIATR